MQQDYCADTDYCSNGFTQQLVALPSHMQVPDPLLQDLNQNYQPLQLHQQ